MFFALANPKRRYDRIGQLSWQIFIRDARLLKYKVPLNPNINNTIPQNLQEDNTQANQTNKPNSHTKIQENNARVEIGQRKDQSDNCNSKKRKRKSSTMPSKNNKKTVNRAVMKQLSMILQKHFRIFLIWLLKKETASNHNENGNLHLDKHNRYISIICQICKGIQTQHRYLFEVAGGFIKNICGKAFCAPCGASWLCEGEPWRC